MLLLLNLHTMKKPNLLIVFLMFAWGNAQNPSLIPPTEDFFVIEGEGRERFSAVLEQGAIAAGANCNLPISSLVWKKARIWKPPSVCVRSWQSIVMRCCRFRKWRRNMALISLARRRMRRKRCSGSTSLIWRQ